MLRLRLNRAPREQAGKPGHVRSSFAPAQQNGTQILLTEKPALRMRLSSDANAPVPFLTPSSKLASGMRTVTTYCLRDEGLSTCREKMGSDNTIVSGSLG